MVDLLLFPPKATTCPFLRSFRLNHGVCVRRGVAGIVLGLGRHRQSTGRMVAFLKWGRPGLAGLMGNSTAFKDVHTPTHSSLAVDAVTCIPPRMLHSEDCEVPWIRTFSVSVWPLKLMAKSKNAHPSSGPISTSVVLAGFLGEILNTCLRSQSKASCKDVTTPDICPIACR